MKTNIRDELEREGCISQDLVGRVRNECLRHANRANSGGMSAQLTLLVNYGMSDEDILHEALQARAERMRLGLLVSGARVFVVREQAYATILSVDVFDGGINYEVEFDDGEFGVHTGSEMTIVSAGESHGPGMFQNTPAGAADLLVNSGEDVPGRLNTALGEKS